MKKRIVILSNRRASGAAMKQQLESLFGDILDVDSYSLESEVKSMIVADLILSLSYQIVGYFIKNLAPDSDIYIVRCTVMRTGWRKVMQLSAGTKAYVIGDHDNASILTATLYELGAQHLELVSYNPNFIPDTNVKVAIVMNDMEKVPNAIERVINIGERVLDAYTLFDVISKLGLLNQHTSNIIVNHMGEIIPRSAGFVSMIGNIMGEIQYLQNAINEFEEGLILFNGEGSIIFCNEWVERHFAITSHEIIGLHLSRFIKMHQLLCLAQPSEVKEMERINGVDYLFIKKYLMEDTDKRAGFIRIIEPVLTNDIRMKKQNQQQGHLSKYSKKDIVGVSSKLKETLQMAEVISKNNSNVLVYGETGSGKELFAHTIHEGSERKHMPFVAFNCAAVSDTLIASELFGYEDGAFTGAKKGGKKGLFEVADSGTLFLDEIGEISKDFQANLLRVLQEKEIIRVGGTKVIPVDVRIIAATNKDLSILVHEGAFRADLYYRLNVMRLYIPPLRERAEDIPYLVKHLLKRKDSLMDIPKVIMEQMIRYQWPGNIRELDNCIAYIVNMSKGGVKLQSLPSEIIGASGMHQRQPGSSTLTQNELSVLKMLEDEQMGRRHLVEKLKAYGLALTENEVRGAIKRLADHGMVETMVGRAGTKITVNGKHYLSERV